MKKRLPFSVFLFLILFSFSCNKEKNCACDTRGSKTTNVYGIVLNLGNDAIQTDRPVNGYSLFQICDGLPDSLKQDSLRIRVDGYFKEYCDHPGLDVIGPPVRIVKAERTP
ncbi:MAG: hypothetical protein INR69_11490 [Mucilaginibacter polytrichastri]|nr:hypothetical protein [Mucilaginibacter polytrichastri]